MKNKSVIIIIVIVLLLSVVYNLRKNSTYFNNAYNGNLIGDVNSDGTVNSSDYVLIMRHILKTITLTDVQENNADVNSDDKINSQDYILVKKHIMGIQLLPTPRPTSVITPPITPSAPPTFPPVVLPTPVPTVTPTVLPTIKPTPIPTVKPTAVPTASPYTVSNAKVISSKYSYTVANINVLDYGADKTGVSDSTEAFRKAINAADACLRSNTCGGTVYAPKGKYLLTGTLSIPTYVSLVGDLEEGTTNGTILMIKHGSGSTDYNRAAFIVQVFGSLQNLAFWYPDQRVDGSGNVTKYPPTIIFGTNGTDGVTFENLYFVNSYTAMDFAHAKVNNSIQFMRRIYGTPLHIGLVNDTNYDTIKMEDINFSPKYWLNSGLSNIPSKENLNRALMNSSTQPAAIVFERLDWFFLSNINIDGYYMGIKFQKSSRAEIDSSAEGEMFDARITDCYYPIYISNSQHIAFTSATLKATGGAGARGIHISSDSKANYSISNSSISSSGDYAIYHGGSSGMSIVNSTVTGRIGRSNSARITLVGNHLSNTSYESCNTGNGEVLTLKDYKRRVVTKPKSTNLIKISANRNTDITNSIKDAINKLKSTGGIVYIPNGSYIVSGNINVPSGIEIRGAVPWAHHNGYDGTTVLKTTYKGDSIFTLQSNSGINGIDIVQEDNIANSSSIKEYPYAIKGTGSNIYIMNVSLTSLWNGIDLSGCDNHYVEHIWGEFYNIGINVGGGSKNGIIRDSHFTINVLRNRNAESIKKALTNQTLLKIGSSTNETILNTFIFGPGVGYHFDGATNFYAVGIGSDFSNIGVKLSGKATGDIINPLLVIKPMDTWPENSTNISLGIKLSDCHYFESTSNYSGMVRVYNTVNWGSNSGIAYDLKGTGDFHFNSGIIENSASPAIRTSNAAQSFIGLVIAYPRNSSKIQINRGATGFYMEGNLCLDGSSCYTKISNNAGIAIGNVDAKTTCK